MNNTIGQHSQTQPRGPIRLLATLTIVGAMTACLMIGVGCNTTVSGNGNPSATLQVVTTSNILADWAQQVGGERVEVFALLRVGSDPHSFQPGARDVARVAQADLIFTMGLNLEGSWLKDLVENAAVNSATIIALGEFIEPLPASVDGDNNDSLLDPHFWFDPLRVKLAVAEIAERYSSSDVAGADAYTTNAETYQAELVALDGWIRSEVEAIPPEQRALVTSHDSLGYFANRYDFRVLGTIIGGVTTDREPSPSELADLLDLISNTGAPAIFTESTMSDRLALRIAEDANVDVVQSLHTGSLGVPGSGAESYADMMRSNVNIIVAALR